MDAMKKQASKLREQVARQQQAVLRHLGHLGNETVTVDEDELQFHQQLQNLYNSTTAAKHFQRDIVRGIGGFISSSKKQMEIVRKMAEDCCKYGTETQSSGSTLAKAALLLGASRRSMENERETMLGTFGSQVSEPLRASISGAPLEDARHLAHRYERLRQEVETQAAEVIRRRSKCKDPSTSVETSIKLQSAERKLNDSRSAMIAIRKEAIDSMLLVEDQQQRLTFQKLLIMVDAEKSYHQRVLTTLDELHAKMVMEKQLNESSSNSVNMWRDTDVSPVDDEPHTSNRLDVTQDDGYFIAKVMHSFDAREEGELNLSVGDYVVVRHVGPTGWSEGECRGKAGWFPSAYVERLDEAPASKIVEPNSST